MKWFKALSDILSFVGKIKGSNKTISFVSLIGITAVTVAYIMKFDAISQYVSFYQFLVAIAILIGVDNLALLQVIAKMKNCDDPDNILNTKIIEDEIPENISARSSRKRSKKRI